MEPADAQQGSESDGGSDGGYQCCGALDSYASKHWNGLIRGFVRKRIKCYVDQVSDE